MNNEKALQALEFYYGYKSFRPMQAEIIEKITSGKDTLILMPTGGGKSICYQIPAIIMEGTGVIVSPLISLMKDQVEALKSNGVEAAYLNSSLTAAEQRDVEERLYSGKLDMIYVSPEKLVTKEFVLSLSRIKINLFAIDEAHCVSAWGHDFRPEYTHLKFLKQQYPNTPVVACTATADKITRRDIVKQLQMQEPEVFISSFDRPNLSLDVRPGVKRFEQILKFIKERPNQSGIVYCLSRKSTESVAAKLRAKDIDAEHYHAGMPPQKRAQVQEDFINDKTPIVCATIAFGMGIDKSNVRWVIHYNMPQNIEGFYQEIGRAGRDGVASDTMLFYSYADVQNWKDIISKNESSQNEIKLSKLNRMQQYATSLFCRRKVLLNYFSENWRDNCGNCDICKNPPEYFNGTVIAQKALSAIYRLRQNTGLLLLIDVLRGSQRREIFDKGYNKIKTYGAGRDYSFQEWRHYLEQLLNQGYIEIAHDDGNKIKLTTASQAVLFEGEKVQLIKLVTAQQRAEKDRKKANVKVKIERNRVRDDVFEHLRQLRATMAREEGIPPYIIFSDATLEEMAAMKPTTEAAMQQISGVGAQKWKKYGRTFMRAIETYCKENNIDLTPPPVKEVVVAPKPKKDPKAPKIPTAEQTYQLYQKGLTVEQIAEQRELKGSTIAGHLVKLYEAGRNIPIQKFVSKTEIQQVAEAIQSMEEPYRAGEIFVALQEQLTYPKIYFALAYIRKQKS